jgi:hypothetical protein
MGNDPHPRIRLSPPAQSGGWIQRARRFYRDGLSPAGSLIPVVRQTRLERVSPVDLLESDDCGQLMLQGELAE